MKTFNQFNESMESDLKNPLIDTNDSKTSLDDLLKRINDYSGENNKTMSVKIRITKEGDDITKIILTSKKNDDKIELINNGTTDDFYHIIINGNKEEDIASEAILMYIHKYFTVV